jgi:hypothetical protein
MLTRIVTEILRTSVTRWGSRGGGERPEPTALYERVAGLAQAAYRQVQEEIKQTAGKQLPESIYRGSTSIEVNYGAIWGDLCVI